MAASDDRPTPRTLEDALDGMRFAMLTTATDGRLTSRPLTLLEQAGPTLRFLVPRSSDWAAGLRGGSPVQASFADPGSSTYVALSGRGSLSNDPALVDRLWNPAASAYFDGKDDPDIAVLEVDVEEGEWWDAPSSKLGQALSMVRTAVTGSTPAGQHGDIT